MGKVSGLEELSRQRRGLGLWDSDVAGPLDGEDFSVPGDSGAGVLANYAPQCNIENTKRSELRFRAVLDGGQREVRFERVTPNSPYLG
jgi:hypothetical protein